MQQLRLPFWRDAETVRDYLVTLAYRDGRYATPALVLRVPMPRLLVPEHRSYRFSVSDDASCYQHPASYTREFELQLVGKTEDGRGFAYYVEI